MKRCLYFVAAIASLIAPVRAGGVAECSARLDGTLAKMESMPLLKEEHAAAIMWLLLDAEEAPPQVMRQHVLARLLRLKYCWVSNIRESNLLTSNSRQQQCDRRSFAAPPPGEREFFREDPSSVSRCVSRPLSDSSGEATLQQVTAAAQDRIGGRRQQ